MDKIIYLSGTSEKTEISSMLSSDKTSRCISTVAVAVNITQGTWKLDASKQRGT